MTMNQSITRATFECAVLKGDLSTVQAYFAQPHVQEEAQETNDYVRETRPSDPRHFTLSDGRLPWFCRRVPDGGGWTDVPLLIAARRGHTHIIAWFFSREAALILGNETLVWLLPLIAQLNQSRGDTDYEHISDPLVLDTLLTSYVFCDVITDDHEKQRILDETAGVSSPSDVIAMAIAHGACVNTALPRIVRSWRTDCVEMLEAAGVFLVGADVIWDWRHTQSLLARGVDSCSAERLLHTAPWSANVSVVNSLLSCSCLDVDAFDDILVDSRDAHDVASRVTPLMQVASLDPPDHDDDVLPLYEDAAPEIARALLQFCDVKMTDNLGNTALHYATKRNLVIGVVLLENGADPTILNGNGLAPLDSLYVGSLKYDRDVELLERLLEAGADPYAVPPDDSSNEDKDTLSEASGGAIDPRSLYSRLSASENGREFIRTHA